MGKLALWIDVETTGLDPEDNKIIELAAICGEFSFHEYCLPAFMPFNFDEIEDLTGISWEFLQENGIREVELFNKFISFLDNLVDRFDKLDKLVFSGYNTVFDMAFVRNLFEKNGSNFFGAYFFNASIDVLSEVALALHQGTLDDLENYKLETVCKYYGIDFKAHSAIEDIEATIKLHNILMEKIVWENPPIT